MDAGDQLLPRGWRQRIRETGEVYGFVLILSIATFVALSTLPTTPWGIFVGVLVAGATAVIALATSSVSAGKLRNAVVVTAAAATAAGLSAALDVRWIGFIGSALIAVLLIATIGAILRRVVIAESVTFRTILGALSAYTLLGIAFGYVYLATNLLDAKDFFEGAEPATTGNMIFFSYTTLTTTGYGNLVPAGEPGQSFAVIEMLLGQILLVTLVARLVSMWRPARALAGARSRAEGS